VDTGLQKSFGFETVTVAASSQFSIRTLRGPKLGVLAASFAL
jgi:hypothetical protein